jgi:DNA-binding transcriptional ArsR family regulator
MISVVVDDEKAEAKSRLALIALCTLTLRLMENWRRGVIEITGRPPDYESTMILSAIVAISAERLIRSGIETELETLANELPLEKLAKCNVSSIAAATGFNRETVRRKMKRLEADGLIAREECGRVRLGSGLLQRPSVLAMVRSQLDAVRGTASSLARCEVFAPGPMSP